MIAGLVIGHGIVSWIYGRKIMAISATTERLYIQYAITYVQIVGLSFLIEIYVTAVVAT